MKSFMLGAVFGVILLCVTLAITESFGAASEEKEGPAFGPTPTEIPCDGLPEKQFAACMGLYMKLVLAGHITPTNATAPRNAAGQTHFEAVMGAAPAPRPGERSIFSDILSKKPVPSDNVVPPSSEALTPYEQRRVEEQAAKTLYEDRVAQRNAADRERREQQAQERQYREEDREDRREAARMQALGMFLGSRPFSWQQPIQTYQPPPVRPPVNCTTNVIGSQAYTNCY